MPHLQDILNEIKWTQHLEQVELWYVHRGAPQNIKKITGDTIQNIGRSFLETTQATIPYHRITKILNEGKTIFDRKKLRRKDKQL